MADTVQVFQDLHIRTDRPLADLRAALIARATAPWRHAPAREAQLREAMADDENDMIAFERDPGAGLPAVGLVLWSSSGCYEVSNIVPIDESELGEARYNAALTEFARTVVEPATKDVPAQADLTKADQTLAEWSSPESAQLLRRFSVAANKSTGSAHPSDRKRWFAFLIAAHRAQKHPSPEMLSRWLVEAERWPESVAMRLALEYEFGLALLRAADQAGDE